MEISKTSTILEHKFIFNFENTNTKTISAHGTLSSLLTLANFKLLNFIYLYSVYRTFRSTGNKCEKKLKLKNTFILVYFIKLYKFNFSMFRVA